MSRAQDLVDLIQTTNEIYLMNPSRNIRSAFIQIDDVVELIMKSHLQQKAKNWSAEKSSGRFKNFRDVSEEVQALFPTDSALKELLERILSRRENRNHFFHDQEQSGLTVSGERCLHAFCDLYLLMETLFPSTIANNATPVMNAQMAAIRALHKAESDPVKKGKYNDILRNWSNEESKPRLKSRGEVKIGFPNLGYEYCVINYYAVKFYDALLEADLV